MSRPKVWIEIRRGPLATLERGGSRFTVVKVTNPRRPGEPTDPLDDKRGARAYTGSEDFDKACRLAATYALDLDPKVQRARARFETLMTARHAEHVASFHTKGMPE